MKVFNLSEVTVLLEQWFVGSASVLKRVMFWVE